MSVFDVISEQFLTDPDRPSPGDDGRVVEWLTGPAIRSRTTAKASTMDALGRALLLLQDHQPATAEPTRAAQPVASPEHPSRASAGPCLRRNHDGDDCTVNRRQLPRRRGGCSVSFCLCDDGQADGHLDREWTLHSAVYTGTLTDISLTGISFLSERRVPAGVTLLMSIFNRQLGGQVKVAGRVLRVSVEPDGRCRVICTLGRPLNFPEYDSIGWSQMPQELV